VRKTRIAITPKPDEISSGAASFSLKLDPQQEVILVFTISCELGDKPAESQAFDRALDSVKSAHESRREGACRVETSNEQFNDWLNRSRADLHMMLTETQYGVYPYAGIPWFSTIFGRDGIITAFETLWMCPEVSRGVLSYLAAQQAQAVIPEQDAEPGKIIHEERKGEMAALKEIPFGRYYGTVDATPLFVLLAGHYYERTRDLDFAQQLWPHIEHALGWIDTYGDRDNDGFVEYDRRSGGGLNNQGWKDSEDAVFHADGSTASPPIALCEVQGYVYEAKIKAGQIAFALGKRKTGEKLLRAAESLRERFFKAFWCEDLETYALALDGKKRPCRVRSSNAGQCLFSGIASEEHARAMAGSLLDKDFFSGWGIRTIASTEALYNPMSYHNGSVWPHDNALIAFGMNRYSLKDAALKILTGLFDASIFADLHRLPELFCGFTRQRGEGPTLYPVANSPQAWASGSVFLLLQACLGLSVQAQEGKVYFNYPALPPFLQEVTITNLTVGSASLDVAFQRHDQDVGINVMRKEGDIELVVIK
jgi:glycogen debranching enzyme